MDDQHTKSFDNLVERYGRRTGTVRGKFAFGAAMAVLLAVVGWLIYQSLSGPAIEAGLYSWEEPADGSLSTTVEIAREPWTAVHCDLVALDRRQIVVGQLELEVPAGPERQLRVTANIPLEGDGIAPSLRGCHTAG